MPIDNIAAYVEYCPAFSLDCFYAQVGTWTTTSNLLFHDSAPGDGHYVDYYVSLAKGTYKLTTSFRTGADQGIVKIYLDGVLIDTTDHYTAGDANGFDISASFSAPYAGIHTLRIKVDGKNGASSNYGCVLYSWGVQIGRTA